jgi:hypothetical protein
MAIPRNLGNLAQGADTNGVLGVTKGGTGSTSTTFVNLATNVTGTLPVANGGTGATSNAAAPFALKGANADITSLTGLTTALSVAQGGTGAATFTANNVLLGNGTSALQTVAPGANGNLLVSNGTTWTSSAPAGGGSLIFLSTVTANNVATADIENTFDSTYDEYLLFADGVLGQPTFGSPMRILLKLGGSYQTSFYLYSSYRYFSGGSTINITTSGGALFIDPNISPAESTTNTLSFVCRIVNPASTTTYKTCELRGVGYNGSSFIYNSVFSHNNSTAALTGIRFYNASGNISGTFRLYGVKKS